MQTAEIEKKVQEQLEKVSDKVPVEVKGFLNEYGWPLVYGLIGALVILLILPNNGRKTPLRLIFQKSRTMLSHQVKRGSR
jgi:hypothetical protein